MIVFFNLILCNNKINSFCENYRFNNYEYLFKLIERIIIKFVEQ